ncbi:MAG TPA: glycoside hydrolase family 5 protein [Thiobacillus sp.]
MTMTWRHLSSRLGVTFVLITTSLMAPPVMAGCNDPSLKGVNLAGAEFASSKLPGVLNKDYVYPGRDQMDYFASLGANAIRLPFRWERIQPALFGELDALELKNLETTVAMARSRGMCVILDVHNYGAYRGNAIGTQAVPAAAFIHLWTRLAKTFTDTSSTAFGLMNEPHKLPIEQWAGVAQKTIDAIRQTGAQNLILISGGRWSGVHEWEKSFSGTSNAMAFSNLKDPLKQSWIDVHQYADADYSGTGKSCRSAEQLTNMFVRMTQWAQTHNQQLFLGEFGVPANQACLDTLDSMLKQMTDTGVWRGWTYWAAGSWWGDYPLSIEPRDGRDAPQIRILKKHLGT